MSDFSPLLTVVRSLCFQEDRSTLLRQIPESTWPKLLHLTDDARLTLPLAIRCGKVLPSFVAERVGRNLESNRRRHVQVVQDLREISGVLVNSGAKFVVLKGLTHTPFYSDEPAHRPQYDFDLYCPRDSIMESRRAVASLGYQELHPAGGPATDHLPAMIRKTGYKWRGDYFDPALPLSIELHYRFWDPAGAYFDVRSAESFWERRAVLHTGELAIPALHPIDCLSYATWHVVRHLMAGNLKLYHVYELAHFLHRTRDRDSFWREWELTNAAKASMAERITFRLAAEWFGCEMNPVVAESIRELPPYVKRWFALFALSPVIALERLNKDELFLHLSLAARRRDRLQIAAKRIFPMQAPRLVLEAHTPAQGGIMKVRRVAFRWRHIGKRLLWHARSLWPVGRSAVRWWLARA